MKTIADNTERDRSYAATSLANNTSATTGGAPGGDAWKVKVLQNTKVIVTVKESLQVSEKFIFLNVVASQSEIIVVSIIILFSLIPHTAK